MPRDVNSDGSSTSDSTGFNRQQTVSRSKQSAKAHQAARRVGSSAPGIIGALISGLRGWGLVSGRSGEK